MKRLKDLGLENSRLRRAVFDLTLDKLILTEAARGNLLAPRVAVAEQVRAQLHVPERCACAALGQHRSTQRKVPRGRDDEERVTADIIEIAIATAIARSLGCCANDKRRYVDRLCRPRWRNDQP